MEGARCVRQAGEFLHSTPPMKSSCIPPNEAMGMFP